MCSLAVIVTIATAVVSCNGCWLSSRDCGSQTYTVSLPTCGPDPYPLTPIQQSEVVSTVVKPTISISPPCIPAPKVISHVCQCQKTIVKPQVYQKTITVPSVQKIVSTSYRPVTETIKYSCPCCSSGASDYASRYDYGCGKGYDYGCGSGYGYDRSRGCSYDRGCSSGYGYDRSCGSGYGYDCGYDYGCGSRYGYDRDCGSGYGYDSGYSSSVCGRRCY